MSIWGQYWGFKKSWTSSVVHAKVEQLRSLNLVAGKTGKNWQWSEQVNRYIARNMGLSEVFILLIVHEDFRYFSYKTIKSWFLSQAMKNKRKDNATKLFSKLSDPFQLNMLWFFSDENNICQDQVLNTQNNCWLALSPHGVLTVMKTKHPIHIMMFGMVTSDSDVMPPFIFPHHFRLNAEAYVKCLEKVILTWIERVVAGRFCV